jgi:IMP cyclohydrolase
MYVGRIVAVGSTLDSKLVAMYRVSARSFPNRQSVRLDEAIAIVPKPGFEKDIYLNPYITYNCLRYNRRYAVVANGTHTDPVINKLMDGMDIRDAVTSILFGMDYEHDQLQTPRITAVIDLETRLGTLGIVRKDALLVRSLPLKQGEAFYLATYLRDSPDERFKDENFQVTSADEACDYILGKGVFAALELPVSSACAFESDSGFTIAYKNL